MKWCFSLFLCFILCSCSIGYENHNAIDAVNASIDALEQSLPKECKTKATDAQITAIRKEMDVIERDCNTAIEKINTEKIKWKTEFFGLLIVIATYIAKKLAK